MPNFPPHPSKRSDLPAWYEAILDEGARAGVSMAAISRAVGISESTLYAWRRWISQRRAAGAGQSAGLVRVRVRRGRGRRLPATDNSPPLVVSLARERRIEVPSGFDATELARLLEVLEAC